MLSVMAGVEKVNIDQQFSENSDFISSYKDSFKRSCTKTQILSPPKKRLAFRIVLHHFVGRIYHTTRKCSVLLVLVLKVHHYM